MKVTIASRISQEFSADDEREESGEELAASSAAMTNLKKQVKSTSNSNSGFVKFPQQTKWKLRKRKVVLYNQEMIDGDTSMEGLVDEDLCLSRRRNIKCRKLMRKLRPKCKSAWSETLTATGVAPDPEYMPSRKYPENIVEINEGTPRRSARCCKLSKKMIQIKQERQEEEETEHNREVSHSVKKKKRMIKVQTHNNNPEIIQETCAGLRRSSRIKKPTDEIVNFRKELKDDIYEFEEGDLNVERSSSYLLKWNRKKPNLSQKSSIKTPGETLDRSPPNIAKDTPNSTDLPPPVRRKVFTPPAADDTTITQGQARKLCNAITVPSVSDHVPAVQVRPTEELLVHSRHDVDEDSASHPINVTRSPLTRKIKNLLVLTESEEERDVQDDQLVPAALMKPLENPRDWNCFQCVYELSRLDARLTISDLDPLLEKKVDGDALIKSSLADLVNVVGLEYSPAVRVIFLVQQIQARDTSGKREEQG